jgi:sugar lactone lactonase YvrE
VTTLAGTAGVSGSANGTGTAASLNSPTGVVVDGSGNIYVTDSGNNLIRKITSSGVVTTFTGQVAGGAVNGDISVASFSLPVGLAFSSSGVLYIGDSMNHIIRKID